MAVFEFPAGLFEVQGSPEAVRSSSAAYGRFATLAGEAAGEIRRLDSGGWVGAEGDLFRSQAASLPPQLDLAHGAFSSVATALSGFGTELQSATSQMSTERAEAEAAWSRRQASRQLYDSGIAGTPPVFATPADEVAYQAKVHDDKLAADAAEAAWQQHVNRAAAIKEQARAAASTAGTQIRAAAATSPTADQNWFEDKLDKAGNWIDSHVSIRAWIGEHAGIIRGAGNVVGWIGKGLVAIGVGVATVSFVAGCFTGVGFLGEFPAGAFIAVGSIMWGVGDGMETAADWGEGKIEGRELVVETGINAALSVVGFGIGKAVSKLITKSDHAWLKPVNDWLDRLKKGDPPPATPPPGPGHLPGRDAPLVGGAADAPRPYTYPNRAVALRDAPPPGADDLMDIDPRAAYAPGTREHMYQTWDNYENAKRESGEKPWSWERWRNQYVRNMGQDAQGKAFEEAFVGDHGFSAADGWTTHEVVATPDGPRIYDVADLQDQIAYELKSGRTVDLTQLAKDKSMVEASWQITYIFGSNPTAATIAKLNDAGIPYQVWHAVGTPVP